MEGQFIVASVDELVYQHTTALARFGGSLSGAL
jgi:hypothetical protein